MVTTELKGIKLSWTKVALLPAVGLRRFMFLNRSPVAPIHTVSRLLEC